ncbi:hypothetical protein C3E98_034440 [Pseudomonas sp. MWU13-2625]|nr:hypothetical protein C3E98_034440 [Pseudomonas sp. MWU13-2625]
MTSLKKLFLAFTVFGASAAAQAADSNFVGLSFGQTSDKINKSRQLNTNLGHPNADGVMFNYNSWVILVG